MRTTIGDYLRKIRAENKLSLRKMADDLSISASFLSAVENGKKKMPESWFSLIPETDNLKGNEVDEFKDAAFESNKTVELNISNASETNKKLAIRFARRFEDIDDKTSEEILKILEEYFKENSPNE